MSEQPLIDIPLSPETQGFFEKMRNMPTLLRQAMARGLDKGLALASGEIQRTHFTGQGPFPVGEHRLGVRSNRLRRAIRWNTTGLPGKTTGGEPSTVSGDTITGQIGANIRYLGAHEYGFSGDVQVRPHLRKSFRQQSFTDPGKKRGFTSRKVRGGDIAVRAFTRRVHIPERAPLRTGIEETRGMIAVQIGEALAAEWQRVNERPAS